MALKKQITEAKNEDTRARLYEPPSSAWAKGKCRNWKYMKT
jgi:hypothetical protein